jgi:hypothetical protein
MKSDVFFRRTISFIKSHFPYLKQWFQPMFKEKFELTSQNPNFFIIYWFYIGIIWIFLEFSLKTETFLKKKISYLLEVLHLNGHFLISAGSSIASCQCIGFDSSFKSNPTKKNSTSHSRLTMLSRVTWIMILKVCSLYNIDHNKCKELLSIWLIL